jgi:DNA-binding MarR family transcriptional regulator
MDLEARVHSTHPDALCLWLRMLTCTQLIEKRVRTGLRDEFNTTLPRFDLMAQLERAPDGMKMNELSRRMMVTGGNITPVTDQLVKEGLIERLSLASDRRAWLVRLTPAGRALFKKMAKRHEIWIVAALGGVSPNESKQLHELLGQVKQHALTGAATESP